MTTLFSTVYRNVRQRDVYNVRAAAVVVDIRLKVKRYIHIKRIDNKVSEHLGSESEREMSEQSVLL